MPERIEPVARQASRNPAAAVKPSMKNNLRKLFFKAVTRLNELRNSRILSSTEFPISQGRNYLRLPLFPQGEKGGYFSKFYVEDVINPLTIDFRRFKLEVLAGQQCPAGQVYRVDIKTPSAVPYAITNTDPANMKGRYSARVSMDGKDLAFNNLVSERFYYLPIREPGTVELQSPHDLVRAIVKSCVWVCHAAARSWRSPLTNLTPRMISAN